MTRGAFKVRESPYFDRLTPILIRLVNGPGRAWLGLSNPPKLKGQTLNPVLCGLGPTQGLAFNVKYLFQDNNS